MAASVKFPGLLFDCRLDEDNQLGSHFIKQSLGLTGGLINQLPQRAAAVDVDLIVDVENAFDQATMMSPLSANNDFGR